MSILLEALRKSEKGQSPVEPPTIHTDQHVSLASEPVRKGPMAALFLVAIFLITWIVWRQYGPPVENVQPQQVASAKQDDVIKTPVSSMQSNATAARFTDSSNAASTTRRTPVESYQPETPATSPPATSPPATSPPATSPQPTSQAGTASPAAARPDTTSARSPVTAGAGSQAGSGPAIGPASSGGAQAGQPQPISYWELPDAIRADVPEIKFSVLVYASEPADRFVLVNGQRLAEGDSYGQGLVVEEIRRDGVVFSYRLYRFLVER